MATMPDDDLEPQRTAAQRLAQAIKAPVTERAPRTLSLLAVAALAASLAPAPFSGIAAAALVALAWEAGRRR